MTASHLSTQGRISVSKHQLWSLTSNQRGVTLSKLLKLSLKRKSENAGDVAQNSGEDLATASSTARDT